MLSNVALRMPMLNEVFWALLFAHAPNRYLGGICIVVLACSRQRQLHLSNIDKSTAFNVLGVAFAILLGTVSFFLHYSSFNNIAWFYFNILPYFVFPLILIDKRAEEMIDGVRKFVYFEFAVLMVQYLDCAYKFKSVNVFSTSSGAGDYLSGTLVGFSSPLAVSLSVCTLCLFYSKRMGRRISYFTIAIAFIGSILPGMMSCVAIFVLVIVIVQLFSMARAFVRTRIKRLHIFSIVVIIAAIPPSALMISGNVSYMMRMFELLTNVNDPLIKVRSVMQYIKMVQDDHGYILLGTGVGNFTSRASLMVSGQYLAHQPWFIPATPSRELAKYILPFWNHSMYNEIVGGSVGNSMANEPFNLHLSILAETGIVGYSFFLVPILYSIILGARRGNEAIFALYIFSLAIFTTNDWLAYPSFSAIFWLAHFLGISSSKMPYRNHCNMERSPSAERTI